MLFDGHCGLCQASVRFLLARDPAGRLRFASLQSAAAARALAAAGIMVSESRAGSGRGSAGSASGPGLGSAAESASESGAGQGSAPESASASEPGSVLFLQDGRLFERSSAALRILRVLGPPWSLLSAFLIVPRLIRDRVYEFVARHRYRWFGRTETCMVPPADYDQRFLDAAETPEIGPD